MKKQKSILLIFTGGTVSMGENPDTKALEPLDHKQVLAYIPELQMMDVNIASVSFNPLVDSSEIKPTTWIKLTETIAQNYDLYDGFVILHGTDTMAYSASALSFMLENLSKPVIFTGSQLPVRVLRSDAKENLLTAVEMATAEHNNLPMVPEVSLFFEDELIRGNRSTKKNTENFDAFASYNYPVLAKSGVHIKYFPSEIHYGKNTTLIAHKQLDTNIAILKLFPGIQEKFVNAVFSTENLRAVIIETFGTGNAPKDEWLYRCLKRANQAGTVLLNISQCRAGSVEMGRYETSLNLLKAGVISGYDMTLEAAVTKLMVLLGENDRAETVKELLRYPIRGEMTVPENVL